MKKKLSLLNNLKKDSVVLGISSTANELLFCKLLRNEMGIDLQVSEYISIEIIKNKEVSYPIYSYTNPENMILFELITNKTSKGYVIDFLQNINFFLRCTSEYIEQEIPEIIEQISNTESVMFVQAVGKGKYTARQRVILRKLFPFI